MIHNACCCGGKAKELTVTIAPGHGDSRSYIDIDGIEYSGGNKDTNNIVTRVNKGGKVKVFVAVRGGATIYLNGEKVAYDPDYSVSYTYTMADYSINVKLGSYSAYIVELK